MVFLEFLFNYIVQIFKNSFRTSRSSIWNKELLLHVNPYIRHQRMYLRKLNHILRQVYYFYKNSVFINLSKKTLNSKQLKNVMPKCPQKCWVCDKSFARCICQSMFTCCTYILLILDHFIHTNTLTVQFIKSPSRNTPFTFSLSQHKVIFTWQL